MGRVMGWNNGRPEMVCTPELQDVDVLKSRRYCAAPSTHVVSDRGRETKENVHEAVGGYGMSIEWVTDGRNGGLHWDGAFCFLDGPSRGHFGAAVPHAAGYWRWWTTGRGVRALFSGTLLDLHNPSGSSLALWIHFESTRGQGLCFCSNDSRMANKGLLQPLINLGLGVEFGGSVTHPSHKSAMGWWEEDCQAHLGKRYCIASEVGRGRGSAKGFGSIAFVDFPFASAQMPAPLQGA